MVVEPPILKLNVYIPLLFVNRVSSSFPRSKLFNITGRGTHESVMVGSLVTSPTSLTVHTVKVRI